MTALEVIKSQSQASAGQTPAESCEGEFVHASLLASVPASHPGHPWFVDPSLSSPRPSLHGVPPVSLTSHSSLLISTPAMLD